MDVPLVEFMYLVFTRMPGESYCRRPGSLLLYLCCVFRVLFSVVNNLSAMSNLMCLLLFVLFAVCVPGLTLI